MSGQSGRLTKLGIVALSVVTVPQSGWAEQRPVAIASVAVPVAFHEASPVASPVATASAEWWAIFNDSALNDLVARAARGNPSIQEAAARLSKARAAIRGAAAERLPQIGASASASRQTGPLINAAGGGGSLLNIGVNLSYEIDLFGRLSKVQQVAQLDAEASENLLHGAQLLTQAETVQTYFEIRELAAERAVLLQAADSAAETLTIVEGRFGRGLAPDLDVARARGEQASILSELSELDQRAATTQHALAFLIGEMPRDFQFAPDTVSVPPSIPSDIPSAVLARRADIAASERIVRAAALRLNVTRTSWLPNIGLTASGGAASSALGDLLKSSAQSFAIGLLFSLPIFDGGRRKARIRGAEADLELATAEYRTHVLTAFRDVDDQLSTVRQTEQQARLASQNADASVRAEAILQSRVANGLASKLDLLDAKRTALRTRRAEVRTRYARFGAAVGLIRALGGGWTTQT